MKALKLSVAAILAATVLFISGCSKSDGTSNSGAIKFTAGGTNYNYPSETGLVHYNAASYMESVGSETSGSSTSMVIRVAGNATGTYAFSAAGSGLQWTKTVSGTSSSYVSDATGTITVNINGTTATASFSGTLYNVTNSADSVIVTNGTYSGPYKNL